MTEQRTYSERCPFCKTDHEKPMWLNIICDCGAKYYFRDNIWLDRKTGKRAYGVCFHD